NNLKYKQNIFTYFVNNGNPPNVDYVILNSRNFCHEIKYELDILVNLHLTKMNKTYFDYEIQNTGVKIKRDLPLFDSFSIDLFEAIIIFKNVISLTNWTTDDSIKVLKSLCVDEILDIIKSNNDIDSIFMNLLQHKYPITSNNRYNNYLKNLKLKNFYTIEQFKFAIDETVKRMTIHKGYTKKEILRIKNEALISVIDENVLLKLALDGITEPDKVYERINDFEKFLLSKIKDIKSMNKIEQKKVKNKWCDLHKSKSHSNDQCLVQKKDAKNKINHINDYTLLYIFINSLFSKYTKVLIDSGASKSFINFDIINKKGISFSKESKINIKTATGQTQTTLGTIDMYMKIENEDEFNVKLNIVKNLHEDIILGIDFLKYTDARIDIKNSYLHLPKKSIKFNDKNTSDNIYLKKDNESKSVENKLKDIINKYNGSIDKNNPIFNSTFTIPINETEMPILKPYRIPLHLEDLLETEIKELLQKGIITRSKSLFASPCFIKKKQDGSGRLLIDYRSLNKISKPFQYQFPDVFQSFHKFKNSKYFSKIDLRKGFYQVKIASEDRYKTSFITNSGKYEFTRIPFGLLNAPKFFHNLIVEILYDIPNTTVFVDDILIYTKTKSEHITILEKVLRKLSERNAIINLDKSEFLKTEIHYLGFTICEGKYTPNLNRLSNFSKWKNPTTKKQLQQLLGKINWYRKFIPNISDKLYSFYEKLKTKSLKIKIEDHEMKNIDEIYNLLSKKIYLYMPDVNKPFIIHSDSSDHTIGAVLTQDKGIIDHFSKKLNESQSNYSIVEKEMLAIFLSVNHWRKLIGGSKIIIYTDNKNLLGKQNNFDKKTNRWKACISDLDIEYKHISGFDNIVADELSRPQNEITGNKSLCLNINNLSRYKELKEFHITHGHPGFLSSFLTLRNKNHIQNQDRKLCKELIKNCHYCQKYKRNHRIYGSTKGKVSTTKPLEHISSDVYGPFDASKYQHNYNNDKLFIITFTDRCSRFTRIHFTTKITSKKLQNAFKKEWLNHFPKPTTILSDNGKCYKSCDTQKFFNDLNIKPIFSSPYNPTGNSISERINGTISNILKIYKGWDIKIIKEIIENRFNKIVNTTIKKTPENILKNKITINNSPIRPLNKRNEINHIYKKDDEILIRKSTFKKLDAPFDGPYKIIKVSDDKQRIYFADKKGNTDFRNIKNIIPYRRGEISCNTISQTQDIYVNTKQITYLTNVSELNIKDVGNSTLRWY
ncbi:Retrovirus-related Pol polyprotein from transposon 17.6, partial [Dictyocoela muelleri]